MSKRKSTRSEEERKQHDGEKKLKHAVHDLRINAHKYKSSKRQIAQKLRINNKLAADGGEGGGGGAPVCLHTARGFCYLIFFEKINSTK